MSSVVLDPFQNIVGVGWRTDDKPALAVIVFTVKLGAGNETASPPDEPFFSLKMLFNRVEYDLMVQFSVPFSLIPPVPIEQIVTEEMRKGYDLWSYAPFHESETDHTHVDEYWTITPDPDVPLPNFPPAPGAWPTEEAAQAAWTQWQIENPGHDSWGAWFIGHPASDASTIDALWNIIVFVNVQKAKTPIIFSLTTSEESGADPFNSHLEWEMEVLTSRDDEFVANEKNEPLFEAEIIDSFKRAEKSDAESGGTLPEITTVISVNKASLKVIGG